MRSRVHPALVFVIVFVSIFLLHSPLLRLPYFWDESGYYVPAARDLLLTGSLIPHTTVSNAHPPLVMAWLALWWKVAGYVPLVSRSAMLVIAAFSLLGIFRLAERVANIQVAIASTICTGLYPVFFSQSSLAQVDLAAAGLTFWGLTSYLEGKPARTVIWFSLAALAKETAILAPVALGGWEILRVLAPKVALSRVLWRKGDPSESVIRRVGLLWIPVLPLSLWYAYHFAKTGYVFGNPEFFRYNVAATLSAVRVVLALFLRLWQAVGYLHLWLLTLAMLAAMSLPPRTENGVERPRIPISVQMIFLVIIVTYVVAMSLIGGAVLARYMLTAVPLVIILAVSTIWRRMKYWPMIVAGIAFAFVLAWYWNPPYGFSPEDNLAYRDYVVLHQDGERFVEARYPMAHVLTAWPASDELARPWLGYMTRPMQVVRIEDFSLEQILSAADFRSHFDVALVFSTKYDPGFFLLDHWPAWIHLKQRFFGFHQDLPPAAAARILGGHVTFLEERKGQWIAVIEVDHSDFVDARLESRRH